MEQQNQRQSATDDATQSADGERTLGCAHYRRNCKVKAACCGQWYTCRLCHDEDNCMHSMDRYATQEIMCMLCNRVQPVSNRCVNAFCQTKFGEYFCEVCRLYDSTPGKNIYHCDKCKICRVGQGFGKDVYHCDSCAMCIPLNSLEHHRCVENAMKRNCPVCDQYMFTSTQSVVTVRCGHAIHLECLEFYCSQIGNNRCLECGEPLMDEQPYEAAHGRVELMEWLKRVWRTISRFAWSL